LVTALNGKVRHVNAALTRSLGWTNLYVDERGAS
jgi:hypothetical protein